MWGAAVLGAGMFAVVGPDLALPDGQADHYGYGYGLAMVGVVLAAVVVVPIGATISYVVARGVRAPLGTDL